jgi:hypothetical protein
VRTHLQIEADRKTVAHARSAHEFHRGHRPEDPSVRMAQAARELRSGEEGDRERVALERFKAAESAYSSAPSDATLATKDKAAAELRAARAAYDAAEATRRDAHTALLEREKDRAYVEARIDELEKQKAEIGPHFTSEHHRGLVAAAAVIVEAFSHLTNTASAHDEIDAERHRLLQVSGKIDRRTRFEPSRTDYNNDQAETIRVVRAAIALLGNERAFYQGLSVLLNSGNVQPTEDDTEAARAMLAELAASSTT